MAGRSAAVLAVALVLVALLLHLSLDHGKGNKYGPWEGGVLAFITDPTHYHYFYVLVAGMLVLGLLCCHAAWSRVAESGT